MKDLFQIPHSVSEQEVSEAMEMEKRRGPRAYSDRYGEPLQAGDIVLQAITCNQDVWRPAVAVVGIIRKKGRALVIDKAQSELRLSEADPSTLAKITATTDLRKVESEFIQEFQR